MESSTHPGILHSISFPLPLLVSGTFVAFILSLIVYRTYLDPLHHIPGPLICRLTSLWTYYHSYVGDECRLINKFHEKYGPFVRIAPSEVSISDGGALSPVYSEKGGFRKAPCYANFDNEGHATIFSALDPAQRAPRSKAVVSIFSTGNIRAGNDSIEASVNAFIARMKEEASVSRSTRRPVNVLNLCRGLALDSVTSYLFGKTYGAGTEEGGKLSVSAFVDYFVAFGRFFYLPPWLFPKVEMVVSYVWPFKDIEESGATVHAFVAECVRDAEENDSTFQGRLLKAGISAHETEVQCKDLIFAGTDSTGMNLATICWHLARNPDIYQTLRTTLSTPASINLAQDSYLHAVVREALRLSMANPTRFPRVVPPTGWTFTSPATQQTYNLPPGTLVGLQPYTLHHNPAVFPDPFAFRPSRWLDGAATSDMHRDMIPFGLGARMCIARNLAMEELLLATRSLATEDVLRGAEAIGDRIEIIEWFNSKVVGEKVELVTQNIIDEENIAVVGIVQSKVAAPRQSDADASVHVTV
nr:cytodhrome p450 monooxygenase [Quercus suber]